MPDYQIPRPLYAPDHAQAVPCDADHLPGDGCWAWWGVPLTLLLCGGTYALALYWLAPWWGR